VYRVAARAESAGHEAPEHAKAVGDRSLGRIELDRQSPVAAHADVRRVARRELPGALVGASVVRDPDEGLGDIGIVDGDRDDDAIGAGQRLERALDAPRAAPGDPEDQTAGIPIEIRARRRPPERIAWVGRRGTAEDDTEQHESERDPEDTHAPTVPAGQGRVVSVIGTISPVPSDSGLREWTTDQARSISQVPISNAPSVAAADP
jgi:hypothetical protein